MKSNWETSRAKSTYHFDPAKKDLPEDVAIHLGRVMPGPGWGQGIKEAIANSKPATWATRGYKGEGVPPPGEDLAAEEYDLTSHGMSKDLAITHLSWTVPHVYQGIVAGFGLDDCMARIHVQHPGEMWNLHIDKLEKWCPEDPQKVMRVFIQLTAWRPGQFWEFGNYHWNQWRAGEVMTFDWANMPHSTANAGYDPRVTLQLTGLRTEQTDRFLKWIGHFK